MQILHSVVFTRKRRRIWLTIKGFWVCIHVLFWVFDIGDIFLKEKLNGSHFLGFKGYLINLFLSSFPFFFSSDFTNISRFLNRILGVEVELQNHLFAYFMKTLSVVVQQAKRTGRWDEGILGNQKRWNFFKAVIKFQLFFLLATLWCHLWSIVECTHSNMKRSFDNFGRVFFFRPWCSWWSCD